MNDPNRQLLESAADILRPLLDELVFVGGCATGLLITDPASGGIRPTFDVDTITQVNQTRAFLDALPGFLLPDAGSQGRLPLLLERIRLLTDPRS